MFKNIKRIFLLLIVVYLIFTLGKMVYSNEEKTETNLGLKTNNSIGCPSEIIFGAYLNDDSIKKIYNLIYQAEVTLDEIDIKDAEDITTDIIKRRGDNFLLKYMLARIYYLSGQYALNRDDKKLAKDFMERSLSIAKESMRLNGNFSDSKRLAADIYGILIDLKIPMIYGPIYGPRADKLVEKAIELNPQNPEAYLAKGRSYLFTPVVFGGSKRKAIESFEMAINICSGYYQGYLWLGRAYQMRGEFNRAREAFQKVLALTPESRLAKEELKKLENIK